MYTCVQRRGQGQGNASEEGIRSMVKCHECERGDEEYTVQGRGESAVQCKGEELASLPLGVVVDRLGL